MNAANNCRAMHPSVSPTRVSPGCLEPWTRQPISSTPAAPSHRFSRRLLTRAPRLGARWRRRRDQGEKAGILVSPPTPSLPPPHTPLPLPALPPPTTPRSLDRSPAEEAAAAASDEAEKAAFRRSIRLSRAACDVGGCGGSVDRVWVGGCTLVKKMALSHRGCRPASQPYLSVGGSVTASHGSLSQSPLPTTHSGLSQTRVLSHL